MKAIQCNQEKTTFDINMKEESVSLCEKAPLKGLNVFVDVTLNGEDWSQIYKKFLLELGAEVENNLNKKCNLMIWKDGNIKNFQKAQENKIEVISPGWLDECLDHRSFRDFSNYKVQLKEETFEEPGFTWLNKNKGKKNLGFFSAKFLDQEAARPTVDKKIKSQNQKEEITNKEHAIFDPKKYKAVTDYFQVKIKQAVKSCYDYSITDDASMKENINPDAFKSTKKIHPLTALSSFGIKTSANKSVLKPKHLPSETKQDLTYFGFKKDVQTVPKQEIKLEENVWIDVYDPKNKMNNDFLEIFSKKNVKIVEINAKHFKRISAMIKFEENLPQNYKYAFCLVNSIPIISSDKVEENINFEKNVCASMGESNIKPFKNIRLYIFPEEQILKSAFPSFYEILELLTKAGANIVENVRAADYCVVKKSTSQKLIKSVPPHVKSINLQWIYDCIIENRLQNIENPIYKIL